MKKRTVVSMLSAVAILLSVGTFPYNNEVYSQSKREFVLKGDMLVSGAVNAIRRTKTNAGYRLSISAKRALRVDRLNYEGTLSSKKLDPESAEIKRAIQAAIEGINLTIEDNTTVVRRTAAASTAKGKAPEVSLRQQARVVSPTISFSFNGAGEMGLRQASAQSEAVVVEGDKGITKGTITGFQTNVKELRALNGATIRVTATTRVDQVDASGVARYRIDFEMRSQ